MRRLMISLLHEQMFWGILAIKHTGIYIGSAWPLRNLKL